jgi:hypothetical protein
MSYQLYIPECCLLVVAFLGKVVVITAYITMHCRAAHIVCAHPTKALVKAMFLICRVTLHFANCAIVGAFFGKVVVITAYITMHCGAAPMVCAHPAKALVRAMYITGRVTFHFANCAIVLTDHLFFLLGGGNVLL